VDSFLFLSLNIFSRLIPVVLVTLVVTAVFGIIVALVVLKKRKEGKRQETSYQAFVVMGICFLGLGIVFAATINRGFLGFAGLGLVYMLIGLANRDKWLRKKEK
jgi:mannose/fructose/N-acetylgalactosamine-specific phosphotransferase system component IIC